MGGGRGEGGLRKGISGYGEQASGVLMAGWLGGVCGEVSMGRLCSAEGWKRDGEGREWGFGVWSLERKRELLD